MAGLNECMDRFSPDLVLYVAGVDVHANDKLGRLGIDDEGLSQREMTVLNFFKKRDIPVATVMGGGYADDKNELALRHSAVVKAAHQLWSYAQRGNELEMELADIFMLLKIILIFGFVTYMYWISKNTKK